MPSVIDPDDFKDIPYCRCGQPMVKNPHPRAGDPSDVCELGAVWECIPCLAKGRHAWSERALNAERKLSRISRIAAAE